jgi:sec-independent protein translocase protein TatA
MFKASAVRVSNPDRHTLLLRKKSMFEGLFQPTHLLIILGIALLVLGPRKIPELARGIGEGIRGFKSALKVDETPPSADGHAPEK